VQQCSQFHQQFTPDVRTIGSRVAYLLLGELGDGQPLLDFSKNLDDGPLFWEVIFLEKIIGDLGARSRYTFL